MELNAETKTVNEIFSLNKKYIVPRFQREFSWEAEEIDELWDDITQQITSGDGVLKHNEYFIGCMVLVGDDSKTEYLIVDGQQRLTTITILLRCIVERLKEIGDVAAAGALHSNYIQGKDDEGKPYFKLVNESPRPFFQNELQALTPERLTKPETDEEHLLLATYQRFLKKIKDYKLVGFSELEVVKAIRHQILNFLKFIRVTAKSEEDAYTIFETLNARGLSLSSVDLIKNWIFKNHPQIHPHDNAKEIWNKIRKKISQFSDLETFFRHYWNSKHGFASNDRIYKSFKDSLKKGKIKPAREFLLELKESAELYRKIGAPLEKDWTVQKEKCVGRSLALINDYKVTQVRPFLLALLEAWKDKNVDQTLLIKTVRNLESFHFVFSSLCQERASGLEGTYTRAAKKLRAAGKSKAKVKNVIFELISALDKRAPKKSQIVEAVKSLRFSKVEEVDKKMIQTVFRKVEQHLHKTKELSVDRFSLEHVADQSVNQPWTPKIGNLIPLDEIVNNGIKSGRPFSEKIKQYEKSTLMLVADFLSRNKQVTWDEVASEKWADRVAELLVEATKLQVTK